jgi:hypothetical protein
MISTFTKFTKNHLDLRHRGHLIEFQNQLILTDENPLVFLLHKCLTHSLYLEMSINQN